MALRSAVSLAGAALEQKPTLDIPADEVRRECLKMAAIVPVLLMRLHRHHLGLEPVEPDPTSATWAPTSRCSPASAPTSGRSARWSST